MAEYNGSKQVVVRYVYGVNLDEAVAMVLTSGVRYYHLVDALGSTIALVNDSGGLTEKYAYSAYGMGATSSTTPYRYAGRRLDSETGLYHNRARAYSPVLGRFMQADPIGVKGGINLYAYVSVGFERSNICSGCAAVYTGSIGAALKVMPVEGHTSVTRTWSGALLGNDATGSASQQTPISSFARK